ncbi:MAG: hypothetical protein WC438_03665 [Candidatus Pacearchaeota archaeon]
MISWIIIAILGIFAYMVMKAVHIRHRATLLIIIVLAIFLVITMGIVSQNNSLDLSTTKGFFDAVKVYMGWLGNGFQNMKHLTGNAVKMDWTSINGSFVNKTG